MIAFAVIPTLSLKWVFWKIQWSYMSNSYCALLCSHARCFIFYSVSSVYKVVQLRKGSMLLALAMVLSPKLNWFDWYLILRFFLLSYVYNVILFCVFSCFPLSRSLQEFWHGMFFLFFFFLFNLLSTYCDLSVLLS